MIRVPILLILFCATGNAATPKIKIICHENCPTPPKLVVYGKETRVGLKCQANCDGFDPAKYIWVVDSPADQSVMKDNITASARSSELVIFNTKLLMYSNVTYRIGLQKADPKAPNIDATPIFIKYDPKTLPTKLEIICEENCASKGSKFAQKIAVSVRCDLICDGINEKSYKWTFDCPSDSKLNFNYEKNSLTGRYGRKFVVSENADLDPAKTYRINVTIDDKSFTRVRVNPITIRFDQNSLVRRLEIVCEQNCPASKFGRDIAVSVKCLENCETINEESYKWTFDSPSDQTPFNYDKHSPTGRYGKKFVVSKNADLDAEKSYRINVEIDEKSLLKVNVDPITIRFDQKSRFVKLEIICEQNCPPASKESYLGEKTAFTVKCLENCEHIDSKKYKWTFDSPSDSKFTQNFDYAKYSPTGRYGPKFVLSEKVNVNQKTTYRIHVEIDDPDFPNVQVQPKQVNYVKPVSHVPGKTKDELNKQYDDVKKDLRDRDPAKRDKGLNKIVAFVEDITKSNVTDQKWLKKVKTDITGELLQTPITDPFKDAIRIGKILNDLMDHEELPTTDPELFKLTSTLCAKLGFTFLQAARNMEAFLVNKKQFEEISKTLAKCTENNQKAPNFDVMKPVELNATTKAPTVFDVVITEHYADYEDFDEEHYKRLQEMEIATNNIINTTLTAAKITALSTAIGEPPKKLTTKGVETIVCKNQGRLLLNTTIESHGVRVIPSQDWAGSNHSFDILLCTWNRDLMWWNRNHTFVATDVLNIEFWHSTCKDKIEGFIRPVKLIFNVTDTSSFQLIKTNDSMLVPKGFPSVNAEKRNKTIKVRKFLVPSGIALRVTLHNLSEPLRYVVLNEEYPVYENFANASIVTPQQATIHFSNNKSYAHCVHLGLLPLANSSKSLVIYEISSVIYFCIKWNTTKTKWEQSCDALINNVLPDSITCECKKFSVLAGYLQNTESQPLELMKLDTELELQSTYVIFITVATIFGVYCLLLILGAPKPKLNVYFLGDNEKHELYAYLLVISTANVRNAGTTSNVMIKIHGKTGSSDAHVLNYPDPKLRLLQRASENWFVLTTEQFLGEITRIELWYDCTGYSPSWYCKQITIYDMQTGNSVTFQVGKKFSLVHDLFYVEVDLHREKKEKCPSTTFNDYHTWMCGSNNYNFTLMKRIHVILAMILLIFVFNLILLGFPAMELNDTLQNSESSHFNYVLVGYALLTGTMAFLIVLPIAWMFRWSTVKYHTFLSILAWSLIIVIISVCLTVLIIFGFWIPYSVSLLWLLLSFIGTVFVVVVLENIVGLLITLCVKERPYEGVRDKFELILAEIEKQRPILYKRFGGFLLRPYFQHLYKPMDIKRMKTKKDLDKSRLQVVGEIEDLMMFGVYIVMLYLVILAGKDKSLVTSNHHFVEMAKGMHTRTLGFSGIGQGLQVYKFINDTLINMMQSSEWYQGYVINDPGLMTDYNNKFLGVARIRQHRMKRNLCKPPKIMKFLNMTCLPEFNIFYADKKGIQGGTWVNTTFDKKEDRLRNIWIYSEQEDTETLPAYGDFAFYPGGGYVAFLGRTLVNSYVNFYIIARKMWIDMVTRSVFIEFLAYNANDNIFNSITLIFEQSASGYTHCTIRVISLRLIFVQNDEMERITIIVFLLFALWVFILFFKYSVEIVKKFLTFYKDLWFLLDLFIISMSFACMGITLVRTQHVKAYLDELEDKKHNEFVPYGKLFYHEYMFTIFAGILITVATIRLWKFLRFALMFRVFERTVHLFICELLTAFFCWFCLCLGFAMTAVLLFGKDFKQFSTIYSAVRVLFQWSLKNSLRFKQFTVEDMFFPFFACYLVTVYFILFLYISIIVHGFKKARLEFSERPNPYNIKDYIIEQIHFFPTLCSSHFVRFKGGQQTKKLSITPKHNVFRFGNCLSAPARRMKSMIVISKCIVKNMTESEADKKILTETEVELMKLACKELLFRDEGPKKMMLFYKGLYHGKKKIVDEERIALMARLTEIMLEKPKNQPRWWKATSAVAQCSRYVKQDLETMRRCTLRLELMQRKFEALPTVL